jgi:hypothetical protein
MRCMTRRTIVKIFCGFLLVGTMVPSAFAADLPPFQPLTDEEMGAIRGGTNYAFAWATGTQIATVTQTTPGIVQDNSPVVVRATGTMVTILTRLFARR